MPQTLEIATGARLHFGPFAHAPEQGGQFGGLGLMIDHPGWRIALDVADQDEIVAPPDLHARIRECLQRFRCGLPSHGSLTCCRIAVREAIPEHAGLGSGTQLALALARGLSRLAGEPPLSVEALAQRVGRGGRSAIGIHGFERGGFLVDAGRPAGQPGGLGRIVTRADFPDSWRWLLLTPPSARGLAGRAEREAFLKLPPMPLARTERLCRLALLEILPGLLDRQFARFGEALYEYGRTVGEYFAPVQGGGWVHPVMLSLAEWFRQEGCPGVAQTSWGPTLAVLCESQAAANELREHVQRRQVAADCALRIVSGLSTGATLSE